MKSRGFEQVCKRDTMTYDNRTEEIQLSQGTTYRILECRVARMGYYQSRKKGVSITKVAVHMKGARDDARGKRH